MKTPNHVKREELFNVGMTAMKDQVHDDVMYHLHQEYGNDSFMQQVTPMRNCKLHYTL